MLKIRTAIGCSFLLSVSLTCLAQEALVMPGDITFSSSVGKVHFPMICTLMIWNSIAQNAIIKFMPRNWKRLTLIT